MSPIHYHGDTVRKLLIAGGVVMLVSLPIFNSSIPFSSFISILSIVVVAIAAAFTAPHQRSIIIVNALLSTVAFTVFEYYAISAYVMGDFWFFAVNQLLAIIFFSALYYGAKTLRGTVIKHIPEKYTEDDA